MSDHEGKKKRARRLFQKKVKILRQYKIAKEYHKASDGKWKTIDEPHRMHKMHALNCGDPNCVMCGNPRKFFKEKTIQEKRFDQPIDTPTDKHSNGILPNENPI